MEEPDLDGPLSPDRPVRARVRVRQQAEETRVSEGAPQDAAPLSPERPPAPLRCGEGVARVRRLEGARLLRALFDGAVGTAQTGRVAGGTAGLHGPLSRVRALRLLAGGLVTEVLVGELGGAGVGGLGGVRGLGAGARGRCALEHALTPHLVQRRVRAASMGHQVQGLVEELRVRGGERGDEGLLL